MCFHKTPFFLKRVIFTMSFENSAAVSAGSTSWNSVNIAVEACLLTFRLELTDDTGVRPSNPRCSVWSLHKIACHQPATSATTSGCATAVLLGSGQIDRGGVGEGVWLARHHTIKEVGPPHRLDA